LASVTLDDVTIEFPIYDARTRSMKNRLLGLGTRGRIGVNRGSVRVRALRNVTLALHDGDRVGLIGRNGAGKSTFLRVLSGIYEPPQGRIVIEGTTASLLDMTLGMDPEATGYENIMLRSAILGLTPAEAMARIPEIEAFTELGEHLGLPLRTYSSGMGLRLAFAISTCVEPEILLLDEVMGAGDAHFMEKAQQRLAEMTDRAKILVIASHAAPQITKLCNKALLLHEGEVLEFGPIEAVLERYKAMG
jgi:ABC-2 type transport system ATP-binding protein/lipopolysaccharide transport system ATP-binding protein